MTRRRLLALLGSLALAPRWGWAQASLPEALTGLKRWGSGSYRRLGFLIYEATLWAGDDPLRPPLALRLDYRRDIRGERIAEASIAEIRQLGFGTPATLSRWQAQLAGIFPNVRSGDYIMGVYHTDGARFYLNDRLIGQIEEAELAQAFFAIWLDPKTSAPALRAALLTPRPS